MAWKGGMVSPSRGSNPGLAACDAAMRLAAFAQVRRLTGLHGELTSVHLALGFQFDGARVPLINPQRGIFKPRDMPRLLSIKTVYPRAGAKVWYDDQRQVHAQVFGGAEVVDYAFMGTDPEAADNRWLREAHETATPIIYFLGTAPGRYQAVLPTYVAGWDARALTATLAFGDAQAVGSAMRQAEAAGAAGTETRTDAAVTALATLAPPTTAPDRRYGLTQVKRRLHQASFRAAVLDAYGGRCALSNLPEARLLDAAHIVPDGDADLGQPVVPNGVPLSKIHHAAFDAHLIGIDPDYRLHVSGQLMDQTDGPVLDALKGLHGNTIHLPRREADRPDRARLEARFAQFRDAA